MLLIGTAISMVTAVAATRALLGLLAGFKLVRQPRVHGRERAQRSRAWQRIDFVGRRRIWFADRERPDRLVASARSSSRASTSASTSRAARQIAFTTPQPVAIEDVRARGGGDSARRAPSSRASGNESAGGYSELPDPHRVAHAGRAGRARAERSSKSSERRVAGRPERLGELQRRRSSAGRSSRSSSRSR